VVIEGSVFVTGDTDINNLYVAGVNSIEYFSVVFDTGKAKLRNMQYQEQSGNWFIHEPPEVRILLTLSLEPKNYFI
jgi:hypothetical protein